MHVSTDQAKCVAAGVCAAVAPTVFDQREDDGKVVVLDEHPTSEDHDAVREAAESCPALAIFLTGTAD